MRKGFTLIELLVVIAIIAILAAILFPVFAKAREKARQTSCLSNVKQLVLGALQYVQDYDEMIPGYWDNSYLWTEKIMPYVKNQQVFSCPSNKPGWQCPPSYGLGYHAPESDASVRDPNFRTGYGWNAWYAPSYPAPGLTPPASARGLYASTALGAVNLPAETILLGDGTCARQYGPIWVYNVQINSPSYNKHNDGNNYGFVDGHAKWLKGAKQCLWDYARNADW
jgi:prepilin-type N-terminal cleavage/methylation domain-containing protein/prepilin-type processing-associated H-X9-DG protein